LLAKNIFKSAKIQIENLLSLLNENLSLFNLSETACFLTVRK